MDKLADVYRRWIEESVGSESFVTSTKEKLGVRGKWREVIGKDGSYELRESTKPYKAILGHGNEGLRLQNVYSWNDNI